MTSSPTTPHRARGLGVTAHAARSTPLSRRDLEALRWMAEQYAARMDHLAALLQAGPRTAQRCVARLSAAGLVRVQRILLGEPAWVIPTAAGMAASGTGLGVWRPRLGLLEHTDAVNRVRLHIQERSRDAEWICERALARERTPGEHLPDGLVQVDGRRVAIEVELTPKAGRRLEAILDELQARYDALLYYCAPAPARHLQAMAASGRWPALGMRELPAKL